MSELRDKDLLFGVLSVQLGLATESDVSCFAETYVRDPGRTLAERLEADGVIDKEQRRLVEAMVDRAMAHGDPARTFNALGVSKKVAEQLIIPDDKLERDEDEKISFEQLGRYRYGNPESTVAERRRDGAEQGKRSAEIGRGGLG